MRILAATAAALLVFVLFLPMQCVQGQALGVTAALSQNLSDPGHCSSVAGIRLPGTADQAEVWQGLVLVGAIVLFVLVMLLRRRPPAPGSQDES